MATLKQIETGLEYTFVEPSTNKNGTPLVDLDHVSIYEDIGAGPVHVLDVPASSPTGGQSKTVVITNPVGEDQESNVTVFGIAVDDNNRQSEKGAEVTIQVDNLPPAPPL